MDKSYNTKEWDKLFDKLEKASNRIVDDLNDYLLKFFKNSFDTKSFNNVKWKPSRNNRNTLIDTGELKRSIRTVSKSLTEIHITSDTPYSAIHNEGGTIRITDKMRKFFWSKYYDTKNDNWKWMALTKKSYITIPKRQFMGEPNTLDKEINKIITSFLK